MSKHILAFAAFIASLIAAQYFFPTVIRDVMTLVGYCATGVAYVAIQARRPA